MVCSTEFGSLVILIIRLDNRASIHKVLHLVHPRLWPSIKKLMQFVRSQLECHIRHKISHEYPLKHLEVETIVHIF